MPVINCISMEVQLPLKFTMKYNVEEGEGYASIGCEESGAMMMTFNTSKSDVMNKIYKTIRKAREFKEAKECKTEDLEHKKEELLVKLKDEIVRKNSKASKNKKIKKNMKRIKELRKSIDSVSKKISINNKQAKDNELKAAIELITTFGEEDDKDYKVDTTKDEQNAYDQEQGWSNHWRGYWASW